MPTRRIVLLGATGSIGRSTLDVVRADADRLELVAVAANGRWRELAEICHEFRTQLAVIADPALRGNVDLNAFPPETTVRFGPEAVIEAARLPEADIVLAAIVGAAGLEGAWAAVECGKTLAVANKETLVVAGPLVVALARQTGSTLLPVDSEHSAIFQALRCGQPEEVQRIVLTASGGPFRTRPLAELESVTPDQALAHPTWTMGPKITIDSATMMNKALEVIEARWLFDVPSERIGVLVHPQSVVHSFVEFRDGSVLAQLSPPDMRLPIQYALAYPDRRAGVARRMDWNSAFSLQFEPPDLDRFPALALGFEVARVGGTAGAVLNAANEVAVDRFLKGTIRFPEIARACRCVVDGHNFESTPSLATLKQLDCWARQEMAVWTSSHSH